MGSNANKVIPRILDVEANMLAHNSYVKCAINHALHKNYVMNAMKLNIYRLIVAILCRNTINCDIILILCKYCDSICRNTWGIAT